MAGFSESGTSSSSIGSSLGIDNIYCKELKTLLVDVGNHRDNREEANNYTKISPTYETEETLGPIEVSSCVEFTTAFENLQEKSDNHEVEDFLANIGGETTNPIAPVKETIFRKELTKLIIGTSNQRTSIEMKDIDNKLPLAQELEQILHTKEVKTNNKIVIEVENVLNNQEKVVNEERTNIVINAKVDKADLSIPSKKIIYKKEVNHLEVMSKDNEEGVKIDVEVPMIELVEGKSKVKGVSLTMGSKTELTNLAVINEKVMHQQIVDDSTRIELEKIHGKESVPIEGKVELKGVSSTIGSMIELKNVTITKEKFTSQYVAEVHTKTKPKNVHEREQTLIERKVEFKGVSSTLGSVMELRSIPVSADKVMPQDVTDVHTKTRAETDNEKEQTPIEKKVEFKGVSSTVGFVTELKSLIITKEKVIPQDVTDVSSKIKPQSIHENDSTPVEEKVELKDVSSTIGSVIELKTMAVAKEKLISQDVSEVSTKIEPEIIHEKEPTAIEEKVEFKGGFSTIRSVIELKNMEIIKEKIISKDVNKVFINIEPKSVHEKEPIPVKEKVEFKGVFSSVGSMTELKNMEVIKEKVTSKDFFEVSTKMEQEIIYEKEPTIVEGKVEFKGVTSTVGSMIELKSVAIRQEKVKVEDVTKLLTKIEPKVIHKERLISVLKTVVEGQVEDESIIQKETKELKQKSKNLSTGALEMKAKVPAVGEVGSSFERKRKRIHVPLSILKRMEKDPIVAQHFEQLESSTEETISDSTHNSKRLLHTTSHLRRTTDSVGLKYVNQYIVIKVLGYGTFGKVKLCLNTMDCKLYAVKIVHRKWLTRHSIGGTTENVGHGAMREIAIMKKLNHPNIVALHEVIDDPSKRKLYLVLEYVEGGPIMGNEKWHPFPEDKARLYFKDMCRGIDYLHFNKVVHRDLKPGNLLQTLDGKVKISDFGVSHMFEQESDSMHDTAGTPAFLAPEVCSGVECQGRPADMWSLGVCLYVMVFAKIPFSADSIAEMFQAIMHKEGIIAGVLFKDQNFKGFERYSDSHSYEGSEYENITSWNHAT